MNITLTLTTKQAAGVTAAVNEFNSLQPEGWVPFTPEQYASQRLTGLCDSYYTSYQCGAIPVSQFILRFTGAETDAIKARAAVDPNLAGFLAALDTAPDGKVWLLSDLVAQGLMYLQAIGILTSARAAVVGAV